jgi:hypothetical protein
MEIVQKLLAGPHLRNDTDEAAMREATATTISSQARKRYMTARAT